MNALISLLTALGITLAVEVPLGMLFFLRILFSPQSDHPCPRPRPRDAAAALILVNLITNPLLNGVLMLLWTLTGNYAAYYTAIAIGEICVLFGEAMLYRAMLGIGARPALLASFCLNAASFLTGLAISGFLGS